MPMNRSAALWLLRKWWNGEQMDDSFASGIVTIKKSELLFAIRKNREEHRSTFLRAQEGYRAAVIAELERSLADAREGKRIRRSIELIEPIERNKDYDRVIKMLEMSTAEEVTVSETQFAQYVLDEWDWKAQFNLSNLAYAAMPCR